MITLGTFKLECEQVLDVIRGVFFAHCRNYGSIVFGHSIPHRVLKPKCER